ncbi:MAG: magnesium chelatase [Aquifex sp.]|nr:MAG: magnesium chelatase [Aquifex sp.]
MFTKVNSGGLWGIEGFPVEVQVDVSPGLPVFNIVGLPDSSVREAKERVRAAIKNSGFPFPLKRITVNLSPSDRKKQGTFYDLPMALGILEINEVLKTGDFVILGELSLDGNLKKVNGVLAVLISLKQKGFTKFIIPKENAGEASLISGIEVYAFEHLREVVEFLQGKVKNNPLKGSIPSEEDNFEEDLLDVKGQTLAKRALEISAAGFHHLLFVGSAGAGKSMLAKRIKTIAPPMEFEEILEVSKIYSVAGLLEDGLITTRPFQAPHHTSSEVALIGGGNPPKPGVISLAHKGYLLLDEMAEFPRKTLEALRQPLEDGKVQVSRASFSVTFPAEFTLIGTMNPCPCGNYNNPFRVCTCSEREIKNYNKKISEPIKDRIDLKVWVYPVDEKELINLPEGESSQSVRKRVSVAYEIQKERGKINSRLTNKEVEEFCVKLLTQDAKKVLKNAVKNLNLSARSYFKLLKVARTIADLEESENINESHIYEALQFRI